MTIRNQAVEAMSNTEKDQKWLAFELHDRLMPWIHGARMQLTNLKVTPDGEQQLEVAKQCLTIAAEEGRALIGFLESQTQGSHRTLEEAIRRYVVISEPLASQSKQTLRIGDPFVVREDWLPGKAWPIQRIIEQSIANAIQHAGPCLIEVTANVEPTCDLFQIRDNGQGFDAEDVRPGHFGVNSMKERAESLRAELKICSSRGQGTTVSLQVPR